MKSSIRVVVAEDEPAILRGLKSAIVQMSEDFTISAAYNGEEALKQIREVSPHIVISDIHMPIMDGLAMIKQARKEGCQATFIILTGFAEFDYARTALTLGVTDYLLKPVDLEQLETVMTEVKNKILSQIRRAQNNYIKNQFYNNLSSKTGNAPLEHYHMHLLFCYYGPIVSNIYGEFNKAGELANIQSQQLSDLLENRFCVFLYSFTGNYFNEHIYAIVYPQDSVVEMHKIVDTIRQHTLTETPYTNYVLSEKITDGADILHTVQNAYLFTLFQIPFGRSTTLTCNPSQTSDSTIRVTSSIESLSMQLLPSLDESKLSDLLKQLTAVWEKEQVTQFQLQADIRYLCSYSLQKSPCFQGIVSDPADIISSSYSFEDLYENLELEIKKILLIEETSTKKDNAKSLIQDVKNYLDTNFTNSITYKTFYDLFGYNEKYITTLFKEEYGISPSKYIVELRLDLAKQLMKHNPDMFLKDIAETVGYSDALYFSRVFKNSIGESPSSFMKKCEK